MECYCGQKETRPQAKSPKIRWELGKRRKNGDSEEKTQRRLAGQEEKEEEVLILD